MAIKVGINGYGRIGRNILRALYEAKRTNEIQIVAVKELQAAGKRVRLVSMPCCESFDAQPAPYRESVLPAAVTRRLAVEAGSTQSWWRYVGSAGRVMGIDQFGASGKGPDLFKHYGLTAPDIKTHVEQLLAQ